MSDIRQITFKKYYKVANLALSAAPLILPVTMYLFPKEDTAVKVLFIITGIVGAALLLYKTKRRYRLDIVTTGRILKIGIWEGNKKDAEKFAEKANAALEKHRADAAAGSHNITSGKDFAYTKNA